MTSWLKPHRIFLLLIAAGLIALVATSMRWYWLPNYYGALIAGIWKTLLILVVTCLLGFLLAVPIGLVQVTGPKPLSMLCQGFCTVIRGTPLLLQLWLLYYGLGSLFPQIPQIRDSFLWPYLREAWPYAVLSLTLSFAGYEGEVMRGAFAGNQGATKAYFLFFSAAGLLYLLVTLLSNVAIRRIERHAYRGMPDVG